MVKENSLISVILPVYNSEKYLNRTITSVVQQTYENIELIIIDDCSIDHSVQLVQHWMDKDSRIQLVSSPVNQGVAKERNQGIALAKGQYIAFIDSDDTWHSKKLEQQLAFMQRTGCDFSCTAYHMVNDNGQQIKSRKISHTDIQLQDLLKENYICCSTAMLHSQLAKQHQMTLDFTHEDYVYWLELLQAGAKGKVLNQCLTNYRLAQTGRSANKRKAALGRWKIYREYMNYSIIRSSKYFLYYAWNGWKKYRKDV